MTMALVHLPLLFVVSKISECYFNRIALWLIYNYIDPYKYQILLTHTSLFNNKCSLNYCRTFSTIGFFGSVLYN